MKALIFSDLHCHNYKQFDLGGSRLKNCLNVLDLVVEKANNEGIEYILFGGDLYDSQQQIPTIVINAVTAKMKELADSYPDVKWLAVTGNHDQASKSLYDKPAVSALSHIETVCDTFTVIDNAESVMGNKQAVCHAIPYYEYSEHFKQALVDCVANVKDYKARGFKKHILMIHQTPVGLANPNIPTDTDVNDKLYDEFDFVFCGHIHQKQRITTKFLVVGSPLHRDLGDEDDEKGYWIFDTDNVAKTLEFVSTRGLYPEYHSVKGTAPESMKGQYVVEQPDMTDVSSEGDADMELFSAGLSPAQLVENYWEHETGGKDKKLLTQGLEFIT